MLAAEGLSIRTGGDSAAEGKEGGGSDLQKQNAIFDCGGLERTNERALLLSFGAI